MESDPYASHLSILRSLVAINVLEIGGGKYSTPHFLAQECVRELVTVESNCHWQEYLRGMFKDSRWELRDTLPHDLTPFDLIFIDNGEDGNPQARVKAIKEIATATLREGVRVVIHDFENRMYQDAALPFPHVEIDREVTPWTA